MHKKLLNWYLSRAAVPYWYVLLTDTGVVLASGVTAYVVNHGLAHSVQNLSTLLMAVCSFLPCFWVSFGLFHTYRDIVRKSSYTDVVRSACSLLVGVLLVLLLRACFGPGIAARLGIGVRDFLLLVLLAIVGMCGLRIVAKVFYDFYLRHHNGGGAYGLSGNALLDMEMKDLLPREPISVDMAAVGREMRDKCVLVTGAAGSIGSELVALLAACAPRSLILIDQAETPLHEVCGMLAERWPQVERVTVLGSVCHASRMECVFRQYRPDIIFHAAAYKHVPMMEANPVESVLNNVDGTRKLADLAVRYEAKTFVMVSTDKAVNPSSVMGCSKRICEIYCQSIARAGITQCRFITTRFGNVLGSNGSVIPVFREQIRRGGPVMVTHPDIIRYFMLIPEACRLVLEAATIGQGGEIFVFDMGKPVRIVDLAKRMIELSGREDVRIEFSGLRPGEKLYEEVLDDEETVMPTSNPKIKKARVREYDYQTVRRQTDELIAMARTYDELGTVRLMKALVPEYRSQNSVYNTLDN